jgi:SlyX protein
MTDQKDIEARVTELEIQLGYQQETITSLNETIAKQWEQIDHLTKMMGGMVDYLKEQKAERPSDGGSEPPPPHY